MLQKLFIPLILLVITGCNFSNSGSSEEDNSSNHQEQEQSEDLKKAPDFEVTTIEGNKISLQESVAEGKPMMIYFTASWCPICAKNWPALSEAYSEYQDRVKVVAISIDPTDTQEVMRDLSDKNDFLFPMTAGHPEVMLDFGVDSQATTVGVNKEGYIEFQKNKTVLTAEEYRDLFEQLLE